MDGRLKKWLGWLEVIEKDIQQLLIRQYIFWEVQDIIKNNKDIQIPSVFYEYLGQTYIAYIAMGIRRQVKNHKDSISFARLLKEISETPRVLSRLCPTFYTLCTLLILGPLSTNSAMSKERYLIA
jgi:hypothetical protein